MGASAARWSRWRLKPGGILFRTALLSWAVALLALGLFVIFMIPFQRRLLRDRLETTAEVVATSIDQVTVSSIVVEDYSPVIDHCLKVVKDRPSILYLVVTRKDGFSLIHTRKGWQHRILGGYWLPAADAAASGSLVKSDLVNEKVYHYASPLRWSGIDWGWIHVGLSLGQFDADLQAIHLRILLLGGFCLLAGSAAALAFARFLTRPLLLLDRVTKRIAGGDLSVRAEIASGDELRSLAASLNRMSEALQRARTELEQRVAERTAELSATNLRLQEEIRQRRQTEQELVRLERLRALGEMAAGISHNLNNILTGVLMPAQLLQMSTTDPVLLRHAEDIQASGQRAADLVSRLHQAVRGWDEGGTVPVDLNAGVLAAVRATQPRWKDEPEAWGISVGVDTELSDVPPVCATRSGIHDVVVNLLFNAVDAMPEGGRITVATRAADGQVLLTVRDTGVGMDEETRRRVFEPFFTTKKNVGTGLGLSTVYGTVVRWGGSTEVASKPGQGATFTVRLPVAVDPVPEPEVVADPTPMPLRRGRILVVEDEELTRRMLNDMLKSDVEVDTAADAEQAMRQFVPGRYHAVLIDLGLPGMPGDWIARRMRELDHAVTTILITGWRLERTDPVLEAFDFFLSKPLLRLQEVRSAVAQSLELHATRVGAMASRQTDARSGPARESAT